MSAVSTRCTIMLSVAIIHSWGLYRSDGGRRRWGGEIHCTPTTTTTGREICEQCETIHNNVLLLRIRVPTYIRVLFYLVDRVYNIIIGCWKFTYGLGTTGFSLALTLYTGSLDTAAVGDLMDSRNYIFREPNHNATQRYVPARAGWSNIITASLQRGRNNILLSATNMRLCIGVAESLLQSCKIIV